MKAKRAKTKTSRASKPKKTTTSSQAKKDNKISKMNVLDGRAEENEGIKDLEAILNPKGSYNPFKSNNDEEFEARMIDMTLPDLQSLAVETGVFPSGNRTTLKNKLKKEFRNRVFLGKGNVVTQTQPILDASTLSEEQKKLFTA